MRPTISRRMRDAALAIVALIAIGTALWNLQAARTGLAIERVTVDGIPATIFRPQSGPVGPAVVVAHGFAGSQQLMQSFALTLARNGYVAVTFDFAGHGRNPAPLTGSIVDAEGATRTLVAETGQIADLARTLGDGRLAVLGHSMASDIVVRFAEATPDVAATVAVSMFSPAVTATAPRNLLVIVGGWEGMLQREALRAVQLAAAPATAEPGVTYGAVADGTARRTAFSPHVEHVGVLFSRASMQEALAWLDATFAIQRAGPPDLEPRGLWILLFFAGVVILARPLSTLLPRVVEPPVGASLGWRRLWLPLLVPMFATPLLLRVLPTHFLPVLVGDYLAAHFALYGLLTMLCLAWMRGGHVSVDAFRASRSSPPRSRSSATDSSGWSGRSTPSSRPSFPGPSACCSSSRCSSARSSTSLATSGRPAARERRASPIRRRSSPSCCRWRSRSPSTSSACSSW